MRALKDEGVKFIFGYPGGAALHIYDSIFKQKACEHILVRHEAKLEITSQLGKGSTFSCYFPMKLFQPEE